MQALAQRWALKEFGQGLQDVRSPFQDQGLVSVVDFALSALSQQLLVVLRFQNDPVVGFGNQRHDALSYQLHQLHEVITVFVEEVIDGPEHLHDDAEHSLVVAYICLIQLVADQLA